MLLPDPEGIMSQNEERLMTTKGFYSRSFNVLAQQVQQHGLQTWQYNQEKSIIESHPLATDARIHIYRDVAADVRRNAGRKDLAPDQVVHTPLAIEALDYNLGKTSDKREQIALCMHVMNGNMRLHPLAQYGAVKIVDILMPQQSANIFQSTFRAALDDVRERFANDANAPKSALNPDETNAVCNLVKSVFQPQKVLRQYANNRNFWRKMGQPSLPNGSTLTDLGCLFSKDRSPARKVEMADYGIELTTHNFHVTPPVSLAPKR